MMQTAEDRYLSAAHSDPGVRKFLASQMASLDLHLWAMTREERAAVSVAQLRERKRLLHGYITDAEILAAIKKADDRTFAPVHDSKPFAGPANWRHGLTP